ncbi:hypothetical protein FisN_6Hh236 [Fistulifera solaris]|uniref:Uncharacterized protein n=1 Tax=Fistulifera solaris TaxID=1519565 RepID=A0A1Z5K1Y6_FISSO|nr:hypothetical protein FisN_6Hh236 [Fistulifera solaris]|eukprot:GAX20285.1 hypothetical protein FisN_6Hh236 [Fistulifera solaris]
MASREREWPVRVFRQTPEGGYERLRVQRNIQIRAIPRAGGLVLPRLHIRIQIDPAHTTVLRRRRCLLIYSQQQRVRVLVLQFKDLPQCLQFTDEWWSLNPSSVTSFEPQALEEPVVQQYLFRLLHDPAFVQFCRKLSAHLRSQPDFVAALEAFHEDAEE